MRVVNARRILWKTKVQFQKVWQGQVRCKNRKFHAFLTGEQMANAKSSTKQMRPGPATRAASFVDLRDCLSATWGSGTTATVQPRSRERHTYRCCCANGNSESPLANSRGSQQPNPSSESGRGGSRNAWATSTHSRAFGFPPAIHPRELPVCR